jgi:SHS2 domain-containing protein
MNELHNQINRKFVESFDVTEWEVETKNGWVDIEKSNKTIEYDVWRLELENGDWLECADNHIVFKPFPWAINGDDYNLEEVFVKDLKQGDYIIIKNHGDTSHWDRVKSIQKIDKKEHMYDLTVGGDHTYFINDILSHNTLILHNIAQNAIESGKNVAYFSFEITKEILRKRIDSSFTDITIGNIIKMRNETKKRIKERYEKENIGRLIIKEYPFSSVTVTDIEVFLSKLKLVKDFTPDIVILDYLGIMKPMHIQRNANTYERTKIVCEEARGLSAKLRAPIISGAQFNRCLSVNSNVVIIRDGIKKDITIGNIKKGDLICSYDGFVKVKYVTEIQKQDCYKVKLKSGKEILCSGKHIFPTSHGFKSINTGMNKGDILFSVADNTDIDVYHQIINLIEDKIISIEEVGEKETIDIEVDSEDHLFFANDILTHNSAYSDSDAGMDKIADSMGIAHTADLMISIYKSEELDENHQLRYKIIKARDMKEGKSGIIDVDYEKLRISDESQKTPGGEDVIDIIGNIKDNNNNDDDSIGIT